MPGIHCIPPWNRERSPRRRLPEIVAYLLARHAVEWASACRATVSYHYVSEAGYWVLLRTQTLAGQWLVAALVLSRTPKGRDDWRAIRALCASRTFSLKQAKYRYLFVRSRACEDARRFLGTAPMSIVDWSKIHACDSGGS